MLHNDGAARRDERYITAEGDHGYYKKGRQGHKVIRVICVACGVSFWRDYCYENKRISEKRDGPFCSLNCSRIFRQKLQNVELQCITCGKQFTRTRYYTNRRILRNSRGPFCSKSCASKAPHPKTWVTLTCPNCGITFKRMQGYINEALRKKQSDMCCSHRCASVLARKKRKKPERKITSICDHCGISFEREQYRIDDNRKHGYKNVFCSRRCVAASRKGKRNYGSWKGGKTVNRAGYVLIKASEHPMANSSGYVLQHRIVMEKSLGRYLGKKETVHHKNGIKGDNRIENLELWFSKHPYGQRLGDLLQFAKEILLKYARQEPIAQ